MSDWSAGYVAELDYTHGYYRELSPSHLSLALLSKAVSATRNPRPRYLELGFGQGLSLNIHAAACPGEFWGTDFNPAHAANAADMAKASGASAHVFDLSFAELAALERLPEFDVIVLHGIWSWISEENRSIVVDLIRRKLAVGGVVYISYNCTPGWSPAMPLRHLMALQAGSAPAGDGGLVARLENAIAFAQKLADAGALYFSANPAVVQRLKAIGTQNKNYLVHEYLNSHWYPMPFAEVSKRLDEAKLSYSASASFIEHVDEVSLSEAGRKCLAEVGDLVMKETVRDYFINQQFRKDIYVKGPRRLPQLEQLERFRNQRFVLLSQPDDVPMKFAGPIGEITLSEAVYRPVLEILADNGHEPKSASQIAAHPAWKKQPLPLLFQSLVVLAGAGHVHPAQQTEIVDEVRDRTKKLNAYLCQRAKESDEIGFVSSPVLGGGFPLGRFAQLFLAETLQGKVEPSDLAESVWRTISAQGQRLVKEGKVLETAEENLQELTSQASSFVEKKLPVLRALQIA